MHETGHDAPSEVTCYMCDLRGLYSTRTVNFDINPTCTRNEVETLNRMKVPFSLISMDRFFANPINLLTTPTEV